jgi:glycosyltransferase involved in cell wall biosynthesis
MSEGPRGPSVRAVRRVLILESDGTGHRLQYVRVCVQAIADLDVEIVFATGTRIPETDEFRTHLAPVRDRITVDASLAGVDGLSSLRAATTRVSEYFRAIERHRPDHVYVPYADGFAQMSGIAGILGPVPLRKPIECEGILMRGRFAYPHSSWADGLFPRVSLAATSASPIDVLHFLDPIPYEHVMRRGGRLAARARLIPEPVEPFTATERHEARRRLNLPLEGRMVCCPGRLDARKGVDRIIRAFAAAVGELRAEDRLVLVGRADACVQAAMREVRALVDGGRIQLRDATVSDEDLHLAIAAADVVAAPYPRHIGSSGIVVRAAAHERLVLGSDFGWLGMVTKRFSLGLTCDCRDDAAMGRLLPQALAASESYTASAAAKRFARFHTQANHEAHLSRRLRQRMGHDPAPSHTWESVLQGE